MKVSKLLKTKGQEQVYSIESDFWQLEFFDIVKVLEFGEKKHPRVSNEQPNWLESDGNKSSFKNMHESMFRHLAESQCQGYMGLSRYDDFNDLVRTRADIESSIDPLLHLAVRALMVYTRIRRNIRHSEDIVL